MNKQTIITSLLALIAMAGQANTYKTIKVPFIEKNTIMLK